ncbi:hypothetical protein [Paenibacillus vini]|uniref:Uncharacterized protein n=1 Tax=Paenibacillus vini TaxID=1476024 RepID=A0ABQ4M6S5_9BACL|nr:hypothetical protein J42TS3_01650 [Paenibacillus vini]
MTRLQGKIAIVTGVSRSGGIGAAICRALANEGASLFFTHLYDYDKEMNLNGGTDENWPDLFARELRQLGVQVAHMKMDLTVSGSASNLLDEVPVLPIPAGCPKK